jgi:hypothetical protein
MFCTNVVEKNKTHVFWSSPPPPQKIVPFKNSVAKYGTVREAADGIIIQRVHFACLVTKATDTHSEYVIIIAFLRQQWLPERASLLRYTYIAACVISSVKISLCMLC